MHERIVTQLNEILEGTKERPPWMTYGRTVLCRKDPVKGNSVENFRPITCLPLMRKLVTGIILEDTYCFTENENLLPEEQKGCRRKRGRGGGGEGSATDQQDNTYILKEKKSRSYYGVDRL